MKRVTRLLWPLLLAGLLFGLYNLKAEVETQEKELARIQRAIDEEREAIQVLRAEWSYLNQPHRLRRLAASRLDLQPASQRQLATKKANRQNTNAAFPIVSSRPVMRAYGSINVSAGAAPK